MLKKRGSQLPDCQFAWTFSKTFAGCRHSARWTLNQCSSSLAPETPYKSQSKPLVSSDKHGTSARVAPYFWVELQNCSLKWLDRGIRRMLRCSLMVSMPLWAKSQTRRTPRRISQNQSSLIWSSRTKVRGVNQSVGLLQRCSQNAEVIKKPRRKILCKSSLLWMTLRLIELWWVSKWWQPLIVDRCRWNRSRSQILATWVWRRRSRRVGQLKEQIGSESHEKSDGVRKISEFNFN